MRCSGTFLSPLTIKVMLPASSDCKKTINQHLPCAVCPKIYLLYYRDIDTADKIVCYRVNLLACAEVNHEVCVVDGDRRGCGYVAACRHREKS